MPKHIHAELMKQYAEDAMTTDEPWKLWEYLEYYSNRWHWTPLKDNPLWDTDEKYRRKQKYEVKFDDNLNEAGWCFNETCNKYGIEVSPAMFNNCTSVLKEVIQGYLDCMGKEEVEKLMRTK